MSDVNLSVSKELIVPLIEQKVAAAIAAELGNPAEIIEQLVRRHINTKVDSEGKASNYGSTTPFLTWLMTDSIRGIVKRGVEAWVNQNSDKLEALVVKAMNKNASGFARSLVEALAKNSINSVKVDIEAKAVVNPTDRDYR